MANFVIYLLAAVFAVVGVLTGSGFALTLMVSRGAIHEIGATLMLLCSIVSLATALIAVLLVRITARMDRGPQPNPETPEAPPPEA